MINKAQPVYRATNYWYKYKSYAHHVLNSYTKEPELHEEIDSSLWIMLKNILQKCSDYNYIGSYINKSIKRLCNRIYHYRGFKYKQKDILIEKDELDNMQGSELNITLDEYLERQAILKYVNRLPSRQAIVLKKYFGIDPFNKMSLVEIARESNITPTAIREVKEAGLKRLKSMLKFDGIYNVKDFIYGKE